MNPAALLQAISADPEDDAPRLVYADWLEEHADDLDLTRIDKASRLDQAEFIRLQCRLAALPEYDPGRLDFVVREQELLEAHGFTWRQELPEWARALDCKFRR